MQAPTLADGGVVLRPHRPGDAPAVRAMVSDPSSAAWLTVPAPYSALTAREWVATRDARWADGEGERTLVIEVGGRAAGQVGLLETGGGAAELGFVLARAHRGRGVMARAVRLYVGWAFEHLDVEVVHWRAIVGNWASRRVAWACGFAVEGTVRGLLLQRGRRRDGWVGSLRRGEPMQPRHAWLEAPELPGPGVHLRPDRAADAARIVEACSAPSTRAWLPMLPTPYTAADAEAYLADLTERQASGRALGWAVTTPDEDLLRGQVGLSLDGAAASGEVGYWVHPDSRGGGVATGAVRAVARHALLPVADGGLGLARVLVRVAEGNGASARVAEKAGFTLTGRDRAAERLVDGRRADLRRYDLLAAELGDALAHPSAWR